MISQRAHHNFYNRNAFRTNSRKYAFGVTFDACVFRYTRTIFVVQQQQQEQPVCMAMSR